MVCILCSQFVRLLWINAQVTQAMDDVLQDRQLGQNEGFQSDEPAVSSGEG